MPPEINMSAMLTDDCPAVTSAPLRSDPPLWPHHLGAPQIVLRVRFEDKEARSQIGPGLVREHPIVGRPHGQEVVARRNIGEDESAPTIPLGYKQTTATQPSWRRIIYPFR